MFVIYALKRNSSSFALCFVRRASALFSVLGQRTRVARGTVVRRSPNNIENTVYTLYSLCLRSQMEMRQRNAIVWGHFIQTQPKYAWGTNSTMILQEVAMRSGGAAVSAVSAAVSAVSAAVSAAVSVVVSVVVVVVDAVVAEAALVAGRNRDGRNRGEAGRARQQAGPAVAATVSPRPRQALRRWRQLAAAKWQ